MVDRTPSVLITGANRGVGLELVRQYVVAGWRIHACCRNPVDAHDLRDVLKGYDGLIHSLDVSDHQSIHDLKDTLEKEPIDVLINNAGVFGGEHQSFGDMDYAAWAGALETNTFGPYRLTEALLDNVESGHDARIVNISSGMGSVTNYVRGGDYIYRTSKTALTMVTLNLSYDLKDRGIIFTAFHPGWVQTGMGGAKADLTPEQSAMALKQSIDALTSEQNGAYLNYDGATIPW
ncbi:MAG: SDR family oxidoreductase [Rhodospirillales bacterium]|jgi:NAD(P)-dependent dehydrogenase (short-subunit alcohol dehydrogenase family)|nr:SDR family oxidoreductase [Rhodospirillales bacterium]MBT4038980.1 SDR family oxidoreductase [Rhodospirillales bacterium]MBT4626652.1 SDR family oxidoreductase [Rhodospirillales bacterium]MBT5351876.1 SDR family oxidoreductase [Rhodospirillales bacterium]MBT5520636.1 SDR family oxidoreductase [Rhodospirillales bacterium]